MHFNVRGLLEWAKIDETTLKTGKYKDTLSPFRPIHDTDREEIQGISDDVYGQFVQAVAQGRNLPEARVREIAEGRIYTGKRAKELKLVDELGGLRRRRRRRVAAGRPERRAEGPVPAARARDLSARPDARRVPGRIPGRRRKACGPPSRSRAG